MTCTRLERQVAPGVVVSAVLLLECGTERATVFVNVVVPIFMRLFVEESVSDRARGRLAKRHR